MRWSHRGGLFAPAWSPSALTPPEVDPAYRRTRTSALVSPSVHHVQLVEPHDLPRVAVRVGEAAGVAQLVLADRQPRAPSGVHGGRDGGIDLLAALRGEAVHRRGGLGRVTGLAGHQVGEAL